MRGMRPGLAISSPRSCRSVCESWVRGHPHTLTVRGSLAQWAGEAGDAAEGRREYAALLTIRQQVLGPEHPDTLSTRSNLASVTGEAGDAAGLVTISPSC